MATSSNVVVKEYDELTVVKMPVASGTVIAYGDLIKSSSGIAAVLDSSANTYFVGVALDGSESGSVASIAIATNAVVQLKVASTSSAAAVGDAFKYSAGANGTAWQVTKCTSGVSGITWALETIAAGSSGDFRIAANNMKSGFQFDAIS